VEVSDNLFNELADIYKFPIFTNEYGKFVCPVCEKTYAREVSAHKHYNAMTCFSMRDVFADTKSEARMYDMYKAVMAVLGAKNRITMRTFRRSPQYKTIGNFFLFCYSNKIRVWEDYFNFGLEFYPNNGNHFGMLPYMMRESTLQKYYCWRREHLTDDASESYIDQFEDFLIEDTGYMLQALERGEFKLGQLLARVGAEYIENMNPLHEQRLIQLMEKYPSVF
jgi:hypothetical protein